MRRIAAAGLDPTLVLHGRSDTLVPASASEDLANAPGVERRTFPNLRHELHNEPEGPEIVGSIITWLQQKTAGALLATPAV